MSSVHLGLSRRKRGNWLVTFALGVMATGLLGHETSLPVQVVWFEVSMVKSKKSFLFNKRLHPEQLCAHLIQPKASAQLGTFQAMALNPASRVHREPTSRIWDGRFASPAAED